MVKFKILFQTSLFYGTIKNKRKIFYMSFIELIAVIFSLGSVILAAKNSRWCWWVGLVGIIFYQGVFYSENLWGNFLLQFIFIIQSILGILNWTPSKTKISWNKRWKLNILFIPLIWIVLYVINSFYSYSINYLDITTSTLSIMGVFLLAYRKIDSWFYWIIADILYVVMFYNLSLYLSMSIYFIFTIISMFGLMNWLKLKNKNEKI